MWPPEEGTPTKGWFCLQNSRTVFSFRFGATGHHSAIMLRTERQGEWPRRSLSTAFMFPRTLAITNLFRRWCENFSPPLTKETVGINCESLIRTREVLRLMEDNYSFKNNKDVPRRRQRWIKKRNSRVDMDCMHLVQNLTEIKGSDRRKFFALNVTFQGSTLFSIFWCLSEWKKTTWGSGFCQKSQVMKRQYQTNMI